MKPAAANGGGKHHYQCIKRNEKWQQLAKKQLSISHRRKAVAKMWRIELASWRQCKSNCGGNQWRRISQKKRRVKAWRYRRENGARNEEMWRKPDISRKRRTYLKCNLQRGKQSSAGNNRREKPVARQWLKAEM
jgi:hypothetical protein